MMQRERSSKEHTWSDLIPCFLTVPIASVFILKKRDVALYDIIVSIGSNLLTNPEHVITVLPYMGDRIVSCKNECDKS